MPKIKPVAEYNIIPIMVGIATAAKTINHDPSRVNTFQGIPVPLYIQIGKTPSTIIK
jgi:hypothetical protein